MHFHVPLPGLGLCIISKTNTITILMRETDAVRLAITAVLVAGVSMTILVVVSLMMSLRRRRLCVAICCIDPRLDEVPGCLACLRGWRWPGEGGGGGGVGVHVVGCLRRSDRRLIQRSTAEGWFDALLLVDPYPDPQPHHDYQGLARQRTLAWDYARCRGFDALMFVDSDVRPAPSTPGHLMFALFALGADVACVPYRVRWRSSSAEPPMLGYGNVGDGTARIAAPPLPVLPFAVFTVCGMGCTALRCDSPRLPTVFRVASALGILGEDIGFCLDAVERGARMVSAQWVPVPRHLPVDGGPL